MVVSVFGSAAAVLLLVASVAVKGASSCAGSSANQGTFKAAAGLMADDAACGCSDKPASRCSTLGVGAGGSRAI